MLRPSRRTRAVLTVALSVALHAALGVGAAGRAKEVGDAADLARGLRSGKARQNGDTALRQARRLQLVARAREDLRRGALHLGAFLLEANAIDAEQQRVPFDLREATRRYGERVRQLRQAAASVSVPDAMAEVFGDLSYAGLPGGRMGDLLLQGRGSCEPVAHLVAAAAYDAGLRSVRLRYYGGELAGATHVAPVLTGGSREVDLTSGQPAAPGGALFRPEELIDTYARARGLEPPVAQPGVPDDASERGWLRGASSAMRSMTAGYPPNSDVFEGALPLFAERAVRSATSDARGGDPAGLDSAVDLSVCSYVVRFAGLDPPSVVALVGGRAVPVALFRVPMTSTLDRLSSQIVAVEQLARRLKADPIDSLHVAACLAALYEKASTDFALAGQADVATRALAEADAARRRGAAALDRIASSGVNEAQAAALLRTRHGGHNWMLLFIPEVDPLYEELLRACSARDVGCDTDMAGAIVAPRTRKWAVDEASRWPASEQLYVMHEVFRAHDNAPPWRSDWVLDPMGDVALSQAPFARAYRVFRSMGWRLWEADRSVEETVDGLAADARREGIDEPMRDVLLDYYARNLLGLYAPRGRGREMVHRLFAALSAKGWAGLPVARRRLEPLRQLDVVDGAAVAGAFRH